MIKTLLLTLNVITAATAIRILGFGVILGGDMDEWGCIPSAGYNWCNETMKCISYNETCQANYFLE